MAMTKADKKLYARLRDSGIRTRVAKRVAEAIPAKGQKKPTKAHRVADELTAAANSIRDRAGGGSRKRSKAARKAARAMAVQILLEADELTPAAAHLATGVA